MRLAYYGSALSGNIIETPEGFLICKNVPIARTGSQEYLPDELGDMEGHGIVSVFRPEEEVFSEATLASFEGKPVTFDHPPQHITVNNITAYSKGHAENVRRGSGPESDLMLADLFITDPDLIRRIKAKEMREVSCGYYCEYEQQPNGTIYQRCIRGNHIAVVAAGRAGSRVAIRDSIPNTNRNDERSLNTMSKNKPVSLFGRIFAGWSKDADPQEVASAVDELMENAGQDEDPAAATPKPADADPAPAPAATPATGDDDPTEALVEKIAAAVLAKLNAAKPADEEPDGLKKLEDEIAGEPAPADADSSNEGAVTVPAEEISVDEDPTTEDEDGPVVSEGEQPKNPIPGADSRAVMAAIKAVKPIIAALPANQRRAASDKAATEIRKAMGLDARPRNNGYTAVSRAVRKKSADAARKSVPTDDRKLGRDIMAKYNPHYMKKGDK